MTFSEAPLWFQASVVSAFVGGFAGVLWLVSVLLDLIPSAYRFFDRLLGGDDHDPTVHIDGWTFDPKDGWEAPENWRRHA